MIVFLPFLFVAVPVIWMVAAVPSMGKKTRVTGIALVVALFVSCLLLWLFGTFARQNAIFILVLLALWIWAIAAVGNVATSKGYSRVGFVIFAIFLPVIAVIVVLILQPSQSKQTALAAEGLVKCTACAELIQPEAIKCKHCGETVKPSSTPEGV